MDVVTAIGGVPTDGRDKPIDAVRVVEHYDRGRSAAANILITRTSEHLPCYKRTFVVVGLLAFPSSCATMPAMPIIASGRC